MGRLEVGRIIFGLEHEEEESFIISGSFEANGGNWCCFGDAPYVWRRGPEDGKS